MLTFFGLPLLVGLAGLLVYSTVRLQLRTLALSTLAAWLVYAGYEALVQARILCSGECNIRVDLLLIYPLLLTLTLATAIRTVVRWLKGTSADE